MRITTTLIASQGATAGFVLLWGSAAIFTRLGLDHASPLALLICRFAIALVALLAMGLLRGSLLPQRGTARQVALAGLMMIGGYAVTLSDTAGLRESDDVVEAEGIRRARLRAEAADLRLWVRSPSTDEAEDPAAAFVTPPIFRC